MYDVAICPALCLGYNIDKVLVTYSYNIKDFLNT